ncbi:elicitin [Phytophthora sojae]|uniref:Elicitin n=2 Tax=Phytophthora sojae TaxID=67593 RepID=G4ZVQ5_PHYSP|nr:elicitin [Phytophthora sojae]ABB56013.1 elicitin-like protein SOL13F [Phytophthora sojae]EGZ11519.1 elicitin [Phytophthora sojae]|eukprot:XP_009531852.1 elicitin [Phytophthora sojae]
MKTSALYLSTILATLDATLVRAAECTTDELTTISSIYSSAMTEDPASCPDLTTTTDITASDYCTNSDCLQFMTDMLDGFPDCSSGGINLKQGLQSAVDYCTSGTTDTSGIFTDTSGSSAFATDSSAALATDSTSSSALPTESSSSSSSSLRTAAPSTSTTTGSTTSDKLTGNTVPPATGSSAASTIGVAIPAAVVAFVLAAAL